MPVHLETTSAISSSVTLLRTSWVSLVSAICACASRFSSAGICFVLDARDGGEIALAARRLHVELHLLELFANRGRALQRSLLALPDFLEIRIFLLESAQRFLQRGEALLRGLVLLSLERLLLDLELDDASLETVQHFGLGVDLHADARTGLVDQVDRLVGQLAIGDVAMRQRGRGHDGRIGDLDLVVHFVALLQAAKNRDGVFHRRLVHQHFLEAALERGVLLDVLAVFVERGGAHAMQLTARERGLEHVAGIHGAFGLAGADHGVQLVDEQDDLAFLLGEIVEHALEALFELAAELGAGDQRAHVERENAFALEALRALRR